MTKFTTPDSNDNHSSAREWTALPTELDSEIKPVSSQQTLLSIPSSIQRDPSSTPSPSELENDFEVNIEQQATTSELWGIGVGIIAAIILVAAAFITLTSIILFVLGSAYIATNIRNWFFPPITTSSKHLKGYEEGFSKAAEMATEAIANLTIPQEAAE